MDGHFGNRTPANSPAEPPKTAAELFAMVIRGQRVPSISEAEAEARAARKNLEWLAQFSTRHADQLRSLLRQEADTRQAQEELERLAEGLNTQEGQWDPAKHPRGGYPQNHGWWSPAGGSVGTNKSPSFVDRVAQRNATVTDLTGVVTPGMIQSNGIAKELQSVSRLPGEVAGWASDVGLAAAAGLGTGGKAVVNGFATAVKSVATLGLDTSQLELIGVTKEDRARGYDTSAAISTASGQVRIAVGTGGMASALSKGGSVARSASGALIIYDTAGNAVGVVQGVYDADQNGVSIANGAQVAGGLLGLGANINTVRSLKPPASLGTRVGEVHGALDTIARTQRTTAILETVGGTRIVAGGGRDLTPAQRALLGPGDVAAKLPRAHAELTALEHAAQNGLIPAKLTASRPFCQECMRAIEAAGGVITSPTTAIFPR